MDNVARLKALKKIFFQHSSSLISDLKKNQRRLVHYTSLETAFLIFKNQELWMRNAAVMNDFSEIEWGKKCLDYAIDSDAGQRLKHAINKHHSGVFEHALAKHTAWQETLRTKTFIASLAIHDDDEDKLGRLSMWRAYGNVAIVLKNQAFIAEEQPFLSLGSSPVAYYTPEQTKNYVNEIAISVEANDDLIQTTDRFTCSVIISYMLRMGLLCNKHPGFHEEREWRLVFTEGINPAGSILKDIVVIGGIPQTIWKIPLVNDVTIDLNGNSLNDHIDRVIIGPCQHPETARAALISRLELSGVSNAETKVVISELPLRD